MREPASPETERLGNDINAGAVVCAIRNLHRAAGEIFAVDSRQKLIVY
jgi:hypothetical protein